MILAVAAAAVVIGVITWKVLRTSEPAFEGKELSVWLEGYQIRKYKVGSLQRNKADEAMRHAGTNAIPTLLRMLRAQDSTLKLQLLNLAQKRSEATIHQSELHPCLLEKILSGSGLRCVGQHCQ